jgi:prepilin-type N-terminal cleavage/methylation domain-containing protein
MNRHDQLITGTGESGFTLLEVMIATLILGLVMVMITMSLSGSLRVVETTRDQGDIYYRVQIVMERISDDLSGAFLSADTDFIAIGGEDDNGRRQLLSFSSTAHLDFSRANNNKKHGLGNITYVLAPDREREVSFVLLRGDAPLLPQREDEQEREQKKERHLFLLSDRLLEVRFVFFDHNGNELESWDTRRENGGNMTDEEKEKKLPAAVGFTLDFWLDMEAETSLSFTTKVIIPVGMINPAGAEDEG